jgi:hypothetical protein
VPQPWRSKWKPNDSSSAPRFTTEIAACSRRVDHVRALAGRYNVRELVFDPWRFAQAALELEREGLLVVAFPQHDARMIPASAPGDGGCATKNPASAPPVMYRTRGST